MNSASAVGSTTGSLANDVNRFSRLFSDHVCADPDAVTMVPKCAFAMTLAHGSGVSRSPSKTTAYDRPPSVNPPRPFVNVIDVGAQALQAPVLLRLQNLAHERNILVADDPHDHDRQITGDAVWPQARLTELVRRNRVRARTQRAIGKEHSGGEALEQQRVVGR